MEKYKANRSNNVDDNIDEQPPKSQDEINSENNANTIRNAAKVAKATKNPYAMAAGAAVEGLDKVTGGKSTEMLGKAMTKINKTAPGGKQVQDASNKLSESGVGDKIGKVADMKGGGASGSANAADKAGKATNASKSLNSSNSSSLSGSSNSFMSGNSFLSDNVMNFKMSPMLKIKLIGIGAAVFFIFCIIVAISGQKDQQNMAVTNLTVFSESSIQACTKTYIEEKLIYVGDKRINSIETSISDSKVQFITNVSGGYNNFKNNIYPLLESTLTNVNNGVIVLSFDIYDLNNFNLYVQDYKNLIAAYPDINFYVLSFGPVDDSLASLYGINNSLLVNYNNQIQQNFNDIYINIYDELSIGFNTVDGISYDSTTNTKLHNYIINTVISSDTIVCSTGAIENIVDEQLIGGGEKTLSGGVTILSKIGQDALNEWNNNINYDVQNAGKGNGLAPAIAAYDLIQGAMNNGFVIPYFWGGGHNTIIGVDGSWGELKSITLDGNKYQSLGSVYPSGLDGLGFISWAIKNGGCSGFTYKNESQLISLGKEIRPIEATSGDVIVEGDIAMLVLRNSGTRILVAEANKDYGLIFNTYGYSVLQNYSILRMSDYYANNCF